MQEAEPTHGDGTWILDSTALVIPGSPPTAVALPGGTDTESWTHVTPCPPPPRALAPRRNTLLEVQPPQGVDERGLARVGHADHQDVVLGALEARETRARSSWLPTTHPWSSRQLSQGNIPVLAGTPGICGSSLIPWLETEVTLPLLGTGAASPQAWGAILEHHNIKEI